MSDLQPTPASSWQGPRKVGFVVQLPSGHVVRMKRTLDLHGMLDSGAIPNPLATVLRKQMEEGKAYLPFDQMDEPAKIQTIEFINGCVSRAVIEPKVLLVPEGEDFKSWEPGGDAISIEDIDWGDRIFIFQAAQGGAASVERFRDLQAKLMAAVSDGNGVASTPERVAGSERA